MHADDNMTLLVPFYDELTHRAKYHVMNYGYKISKDSTMKLHISDDLTL